MYWPFIVAAIALAVAGFAWWSARAAQATTSRLLAVDTLTTAELDALHRAAVDAAGPGAFTAAGELQGRTAAGPDGILLAPQSGTECVWYRQKVTRKYRDVSHDSEGRRQVSTKQETISDDCSTTPFHLVDSEGRVVVVPHKAPQGARKSVDRFSESSELEGSQIKLGSLEITLPRGVRDNDTLGYRYEEWVLVPGVEVFVHGEATDRAGRLEVRKPKAKGELLISTETEEDLLEDARSKARTYRLVSLVTAAVALVALVGGLVRLLA